MKKLSRFAPHSKEAKTRIVHFAVASCVGNTIFALGKLVMGLLSLSLFTCVSGLFTLGMVLARFCALMGVIKPCEKRTQSDYCRLSGLMLILSAALYMIYSVNLVFSPPNTQYHMFIAIAIAAFTFAEIGLNIRGVIVYRHEHTPLLHAIKMINLASSLICLTLTQTALLSFASDGTIHAAANGLIGVLAGAAAMALGIIMIIRIRRAEHG